MKCVHRSEELVLWHGRAIDYVIEEPISLVFTNPYGPIPPLLAHTPALIHFWTDRKREAERWTGMSLVHEIARWNYSMPHRGTESFWVSSMGPTPFWVELDAFVPDAPGWWNEDMVRRLADVYLRPGLTVWDGFMGRGTLAKICLERGCRYIGVEQLDRHVDVALDYLNLPRIDT